MAQCLNCGNQLRDGAKFCGKCGTRQDSAGSPVHHMGSGTVDAADPATATEAPQAETCPKCRKTLVPGSTSC